MLNFPSAALYTADLGCLATDLMPVMIKLKYQWETDAEKF